MGVYQTRDSVTLLLNKRFPSMSHVDYFLSQVRSGNIDKVNFWLLYTHVVLHASKEEIHLITQLLKEDLDLPYSELNKVSLKYLHSNTQSEIYFEKLKDVLVDVYVGPMLKDYALDGSKTFNDLGRFIQKYNDIKEDKGFVNLAPYTIILPYQKALKSDVSTVLFTWWMGKHEVNGAHTKGDQYLVKALTTIQVCIWNKIFPDMPVPDVETLAEIYSNVCNSLEGDFKGLNVRVGTSLTSLELKQVRFHVGLGFSVRKK